MGAIWLIVNLSVGERERSEDPHPQRRSSWRRSNELVNGERSGIVDRGVPTLELLSTMQTIGSVGDIQRSAAWSLEVVVVGRIIDIRNSIPQSCRTFLIQCNVQHCFTSLEITR